MEGYATYCTHYSFAERTAAPGIVYDRYVLLVPVICKTTHCCCRMARPDTTEQTAVPFWCTQTVNVPATADITVKILFCR